jgi:hydroxyacylglutathione hydrolase
MSDAPAVIRIKNHEVPANSYIARGPGEGDCVVIDPGSDLAAIEAALAEHRLTPGAVYCTHGHFDHLGSAESLRRRYAIPVYLHPSDEKVARSSNFRMLALKLPSRIEIPETFTDLREGAGPETGFDVLDVPGHTAGSVLLLRDGYAFTGDTLYRDETWRMAWPEEDGDRLVASVRRICELLPDETVIYPGHGGSASLGSIKRQNVPMRRMLGLADVTSP